MMRKSCLHWCWVCVLVGGSGLETRAAFGRQAQSSQVGFGVIVEKVDELSVLEKAGIQPHDLLLSWELLPSANVAGARGEFDSVFRWLAFLDEQTPRGTIKLFGERGGTAQTFEVPRGDWYATEVCPVMSEKNRTYYLAGKDLMERGKNFEGVAEWEKIFKRTESLSKNRQDLSCWLLLQIGKAWVRIHDWEKANAALASALEMAEGPWPRIAVWGAIAEARDKQNQLAETEEAYQRQAELWKLNRGEGLGFANAMNLVGILAAKQGNLQLAEEYFQQVLKVQESLAPGSLVMAASLNNLGLVTSKRGDLNAAFNYYKRALVILENLAPGSLHVAGSLNNLGNMALNRGNLANAVTYYKRALIIRESLTPHSLAVAGSLDNLGLVAKKRGDLNGAVNYHKRALAIRNNLAPDSLEMAASLNNLGNVFRTRGDLQNAAAFHKRALAIKEILAPDSLAVANSLNNLGNVALDRGDFSVAFDYYKRDLSITKRLAPNSLVMASSLNCLGNIANVRGKLNAAYTYFKQALSIQENLAPGSLAVAISLNNLGNVAEKNGDLKSAIVFHKRALTICENLSPGSSLEAATLIELARSYRRLNQAKRTETYFERSIQALETQLGRLGGSDHIKAGFQSQMVGYYRDYIDFLLTHTKPEKAFEILERARARVLHQMISERDLILSGQDVPVELEQNRKQIAHRYERTQQKLGMLNPVENKHYIEELKSRLLDLRREHDEIIEKIRMISPRLADLRAPQPLSLTAVRNVLDPGTVLLSYCVTQEKTYLFVVRKQAGLRVHTVAKGGKYFRKRIQELRDVIQNPESPLAENLLQELSTQLFDKLIAPAKTDIEVGSRLLIIPDGPLHKLPFNLLQEKNGKTSRYLIEWKPIATVVSATIYADLKKRKTRSTPRIAAFGDPIYPAETKLQTQPVQIASHDAASMPVSRHVDPDLSGFLRDNPNDLPRLPYTAEEVRAIARAYPDQTRLYLEEEASEQQVKSLGQEPSIIHLACHGWVNDRFPLESAMAFTFSDTFGQGEENGILQAWEIFDGMRINADLVVLSACETGLGELTGGEGLVGLTRAFQFAGARAIIASYWQVEDQSTAVLMTRFYQYLQAGKSKSEALRRAQIDLIRHPLSVEKSFLFGLFKRTAKRDVAHPYYWAAFQLIGPWD